MSNPIPRPAGLLEDAKSVCSVTLAKSAGVWRENQQRVLAEAARSGIGFSNRAILKSAEAHESTIRKLGADIEKEVRRILGVYSEAEIRSQQGELDQMFAGFLDSCFAFAQKFVLRPGDAPSSVEQTAEARGKAGWTMATIELKQSFSLMVKESLQALRAPAVQAPTTIFYLNAVGARVNYHSTDRSTNHVGVNEAELFNRLREDVRTQIPAEQQGPVLEVVDRMESSKDKPAALLGAYAEFVRLIASHTTIFTAYVPALTQLLNAS